MSISQSFFLGLIQGLTEFFPISSSAHLVFFQHYFGFRSLPILFDILLHVASLAAVVVYFYRDIASIIYGFGKMVLFQKTKESRIIIFMVLAMIPTIAIALPARKIVEQAFQSILATGSLLFVTAVLLLLASRKQTNEKTIDKIHPIHALLIGCMQGLAVFPGISRSGSTISVALMLGWKKETAFTFSFLLLIPTVVGATIIEGWDYLKQYGYNVPGNWWIGIGFAFVSGLLSLYILERIIQLHKLHYFAYYCIAAGCLMIGYSLIF